MCMTKTAPSAPSSRWPSAVADDWQGRGLGRRLIAHLAAHARQHGVQRLHGDILADNRRMLALMRDHGARLTAHPDGAQLVRAVLRLDGAG
jgi:acetyltransferase